MTNENPISNVNHQINKREQKINRVIIGSWVLVAVFVSLLLIYTGFSAFNRNKMPGSLIYVLLVLLPLLVIGILSTLQYHRQQINGKTLLLTWTVLGVIVLVSFWLVNFESDDFTRYLADWCAQYRELGWQASFRQITTVSNYVPFYNYFLIVFANLLNTQGCLYAIKYLTFIFSLGLALVMELIVAHVTHKKISYLHIAIFLLLPPVLMEFTAWGQCDAIYTMFALLAFYFALKHRSVWCFVSLGLAFAIKLQFLFIAPIIFVMLIIRDTNGQKYLSWKWVWLAPLMYVINLLPLFYGAHLWDLLSVYLVQTGSNYWFSEGCFNLPFLFYPISYYSPTETLLIKLMNLGMAIIGITITIVMLVLVLRARRRHVFTDLDLIRYALCFAMVMVYFMPKMHERFYFIAFALSMIYFYSQNNKINQLFCTLISTAFSLSLYTYLIACILNPWHGYFASGLSAFGYFKGIVVVFTNTVSYILGVGAMTAAVIWLMYPIIRDEIRHNVQVKNKSTIVNQNQNSTTYPDEK